MNLRIGKGTGPEGVLTAAWRLRATSLVLTKMMVWPSFSHWGKIISFSTLTLSSGVGQSCEPNTHPSSSSTPAVRMIVSRQQDYINQENKHARSQTYHPVLLDDVQ
jgi:hypothetical protein